VAHAAPTGSAWQPFSVATDALLHVTGAGAATQLPAPSAVPVAQAAPTGNAWQPVAVATDALPHADLGDEERMAPGSFLIDVCAATALIDVIAGHPCGSIVPIRSFVVIGMLTEYATPTTRAFSPSAFAGYVAVIVAFAPTVPAWHAQTEKLVAPLYLPTSARGSSDCTLMSKSDIDTRQPCGVRGASRVASSLSAIDTTPHAPIGTGLSDAESRVFHGSCASALGAMAVSAAQASASPKAL
jgi:hypothetical protein